MQIVEEFKAHPHVEQLKHRKDGFELALKHLSKFEDGYIIETGTARIRDNWSGDGQSTILWDWFIEKAKSFRAISIDIERMNIENAREQTQFVSYMHGDSVKVLNELSPEILSQTRLLYLDSFDWSRELQMDSAFHHMAELATVWCHLPKDCMIMVDDRHSHYEGKHLMVMFFMEKLGYRPVYEQYQIAWIKK